MPNLIYIADPMCSWCYGLGPELVTLLQGLPETPLEIMVGGLRAYNRETMDESLKTSLLSHWKQIEETTGLPFAPAALNREGFIYNTEPACRAVVAARILAPYAVLHVFYAIQQAFYVEGLDVTQGEVLADVASAALTNAGFPIDAAGFHATWADEATIAATLEDFHQTRRWEVSGFPTLILERKDKLDLVTSGFARTEVLVERLQELIDQDV
jgi:putative protein-disulfide isomerase